MEVILLNETKFAEGNICDNYTYSFTGNNMLVVVKELYFVLNSVSVLGQVLENNCNPTYFKTLETHAGFNTF